MFFMEDYMSKNFPPAITHPEYFYGFIIGTVAWQLAFLLISVDPRKFRALMPITFVEKVYGIATLALFAQGRIPAEVFAAGAVDLVLGVLFVLAYLKTRNAAVTAQPSTHLASKV